MGFRQGSFCTCWQITPGPGNFTKVRLSTSRKNKETGEYEQDFSGYVMMIGHAHAKAQKLKERDRIRLGEVDVSNRYDKERQKEYTDFKCFDFEMADEVQRNGGGAGRSSSGRVDSNPVEGDEDPDNDLPPF